MIRFPPRAVAFTGLALSIVLCSGTASAIVITPDQSVAPAPSIAGTGLAATYYKFSQAISTLAQGDSLVAAATRPTSSFTALTVCFPSCQGSANDGSTLSSYIASNGTNLTADSTLGQAVSRYNGFIAIPTAITVTFGLYSDDGSSLAIGGTSIINNDGLHGVTGSSTSVSFQSSGLYPFYVDHFENAGGTGVTVLQDGAAIATSRLYSTVPISIPEPGSLALLGVSLPVIGAIRFRRRYWVQQGRNQSGLVYSSGMAVQTGSNPSLPANAVAPSPRLKGGCTPRRSSMFRAKASPASSRGLLLLPHRARARCCRSWQQWHRSGAPPFSQRHGVSIIGVTKPANWMTLVIAVW